LETNESWEKNTSDCQGGRKKRQHLNRLGERGKSDAAVRGRQKRRGFSYLRREGEQESVAPIKKRLVVQEKDTARSFSKKNYFKKHLEELNGSQRGSGGGVSGAKN